MKELMELVVARLPAPLPLIILEHLPDFATLQNLLQVSPDAVALFRAFPGQIIRGIAMSMPITIAESTDAPDVYDYMMLLARLRSRTLPQVQQYYDNFYVDQLAGHHNQPLSPSFYTATSPSIFCGLVDTAANLERLASVVL